MGYTFRPFTVLICIDVNVYSKRRDMLTLQIKLN